jgi:ACS family hexuronate transporter-like MFS transporter
VWLIGWLWLYRLPEVHPLITDEERGLIVEARPAARSESASKTRWVDLLRFPQTWGLFFSRFLSDPVWWFYLFWLPSYFNSRFKIDMAHLGTPLIIVYVVSMIGSVFGGWLPKGYVNLGMSLKTARIAAMLTCACLVVPIAFAGGLHSIWMAVALLSVAASAHQGWSANIFSTASDMFPAEYVGTVVSFGQVGGALGGAIFAQVAGHVLQFTGSYVPLFVFSGFAYLVALTLLRMLAPGLKRAVLEH